MKIKITSDSTSDLTDEIRQKFDISVLPVRVTLGDDEYEDGVSITTDKLYDLVKEKNELPKTSSANPSEYKDFFTQELKSGGGYDAIVHFSISSKISSLYQNANIAAQNFDGKVFVIDSASLSTGIGVQMLYACDLAKQGVSPQMIVQKVLERREKVQASFVIDTLKFLYKGGRCSRLAMFGANLLKIKPIIALKDGAMDVDHKLRGKLDDVVMKYVEFTLEKHKDFDNKRCFLTYSTLPDELVKKIKERIKPLFKEVYVTRAGTTVAAHCGPNTVGILYYKN